VRESVCGTFTSIRKSKLCLLILYFDYGAKEVNEILFIISIILFIIFTTKIKKKYMTYLSFFFFYFICFSTCLIWKKNCYCSSSQFISALHLLLIEYKSLHFYLQIFFSSSDVSSFHSNKTKCQSFPFFFCSKISSHNEVVAQSRKYYLLIPSLQTIKKKKKGKKSSFK
jgi:hypothetical protein